CASVVLPLESASCFGGFALRDGLASGGFSAARGALAARDRNRFAELCTTAIDGSQSLRVETGERVPFAEEPGLGEQLQHGVGEHRDDEQVDEGRETEGEGEALHVADGEHE